MGNRMLELLDSHELKVFVLNTGRVGGTDDATSKKVTIPYSSAIVQAIVEDTIEWETDPDFGYEVATSLPGVDDIEILQPRRLYERQGRLDGVRRHGRADQEGAQGVPRLLPRPGRRDRQVDRLSQTRPASRRCAAPPAPYWCRTGAVCTGAGAGATPRRSLDVTLAVLAVTLCCLDTVLSILVAAARPSAVRGVPDGIARVSSTGSTSAGSKRRCRRQRCPGTSG